jgi:hypothetical protein
MGKNKKSKKSLTKLSVPPTLKPMSQSSVKSGVPNRRYGKPFAKPINTLAKNGSAVSIDGESGNEPESDLHIDIDSMDHSLTREPINMGVKNVRQIMACIKEGTTEVKDVVLNECNIIYECKICSNLFRSLANFIAHKRIYCKNHFCEKMLLFDSTVLQFNEDQEENCEEHEVEDEDIQEDQNDISNVTPIDFVSPASSFATNSSTENVNPNKDKTVVNQKRKFIDKCMEKVENEKQKEQDSKLLELKLSTIQTNPNAVFQRLQTNELNSDKTSDKNDKSLILNQNKKEIISELLRNAKNDAKNMCESNEIQAMKRQRVEEILPRSEMNGNSLSEPLIVKCKICNSTFTSSKTFKVHIRTIHSTNRLIYPCPLCSLTFKQLSNATRHIIQIHKRTKTQAHTLREVMRRRAYSANSSENSSEVEDISDEDENDDNDNDNDNDNELSPKQNSIEDKCDTNKVESRLSDDSSEITIRTNLNESSKPNERHPPRINSACIYNCGNVFDWAPAKRSHEKSCRKKLEQEKEISSGVNGSSHSSTILTSKAYKLNSFSTPISEIEAESSTHNQISSTPEVPIVPNHTSNPSTNIILPNSVEEKIKEFADLKSLRCTLCPSQDFMNLNQLLQHAVTHIGHSIYRCHGCSYHSIYENDMKYHLMNNHNIGEDMISKHFQILPNLTQPRLLILPVKARKSINGPINNSLTEHERGLSPIAFILQLILFFGFILFYRFSKSRQKF